MGEKRASADLRPAREVAIRTPREADSEAMRDWDKPHRQPKKERWKKTARWLARTLPLCGPCAPIGSRERR